MYNRNVIENAYYMIYLFHKEEKIITNLQLQKLMYFTECFFMNLTEENYLFDDQCLAWTYGPVYRELYNRFREFSKNDIILSDEDIAIGRRLPKINRNIMDAIFERFKDFSATYLVGITHREGSPWYKVNEVKESFDISNMNIPISKLESAVWFRETFMGQIDGK